MLPFSLYVIGYASVGSMSIAALIVATFVGRAALGLDAHWWYAAYSVAAASTVMWSLRPNIKRLMEGTEHMIGPRAKRA